MQRCDLLATAAMLADSNPSRPLAFSIDHFDH
jgi:hypothetical protein